MALSPREAQVVLGIVDGLKYHEIAASLGLTYETVKTYVRRIRKKLDLDSKTAIAVWGVRNGRLLKQCQD